MNIPEIIAKVLHDVYAQDNHNVEMADTSEEGIYEIRYDGKLIYTFNMKEAAEAFIQSPICDIDLAGKLTSFIIDVIESIVEAAA